MQKKYVLYYDLIKIIATFMVCFYHLGALDVGNITDSFYIPNFNKVILNLCAMSVPLFFMVNGALMLRRRYSTREIIIRVLKLFFLYYFWVIAIGQIGVIFFQIEHLSLLEILKGHRTTISVHLWFLRTMAILTILVPAFKKLYESKNKRVLYAIMLLILIFPFVYNYIVLLAKWFDVAGLNNLPITGVFTMYSILYFFLGKIISDRSAQETGDCKIHIICSIISVLIGWMLVTIEVMLWSNINGSVYDGVNSSFPTLGAAFMAIGGFYLFSKIQINQDSKCVRVVKKTTENIVGVYIFHIIVIVLLTRFVQPTGNLINAMLLTLIVIVITLLITVIFRKIPLIKHLLNI